MRFDCSATEPRGVWVHYEESNWDRRCSRIVNNPDKFPGGVDYDCEDFGSRNGWEVYRADGKARTYTLLAACPTEEAARAALRLMEMK